MIHFNGGILFYQSDSWETKKNNLPSKISLEILIFIGTINMIFFRKFDNNEIKRILTFLLFGSL